MPEPSNKRRKLSSIRISVSKGVDSTRTAASDKAQSARAATVQGVKSIADSRPGKGLSSVGDIAAQRAKDMASQSSEIARNGATHGMRLAGDGIDSAKERVPWDMVLPDDARSSLISALEASKTLSGNAKQKMTAQMAPGLDTLFKKGIASQSQILPILQGWLASPDASNMLNAWLQGIVEGVPTIYDKAMDAKYISTHIGGGDHRLFDGGHTIAGAFQAVRNASPDDSIFEEAAGFLQALARDATTPRGLPLVAWDQDTFNSLADNLGRVGIPRDWVKDMASYDAVELIGASLGVLAIALNWNNDDVEEFSRLVGSMGLAAVVGANPLLLIVTVVALGRAFNVARKTGDWKEFTDGLARGGICTGAVLLVTSMVSGPAVVVLLTGICVGIVAQQAAQKVSFVEIGQWLIVQMSSTPTPPVYALTSAEQSTPSIAGTT